MKIYMLTTCDYGLLMDDPREEIIGAMPFATSPHATLEGAKAAAWKELVEQVDDLNRDVAGEDMMADPSPLEWAHQPLDSDGDVLWETWRAYSEEFETEFVVHEVELGA